MNIDAATVKKLREACGAGMMDCKMALTEAQGDMDEALKLLRKKGMASADKKASRTANEGLVDYYIHTGGKVGVLVEVNCETDFVARGDDFKAFVHDVAMHIAAASPTWVSRDDVPEPAVDTEIEIYSVQAKQSGKPEAVIQKIAEGKLNKWFSEVSTAGTAVCEGSRQDHRRSASRTRGQDRREHRDPAVRAFSRGR